MRKTYMFVGVLTCLFATTVSASGVNGTYKGNPIVHVVVNEVAVNSDVPAIKLEDTTLVPLRVVAENLGATVTWNEETQTASITETITANPIGNETKVTPYVEMLTLIQKHVQDTKNMHERMQLMYEVYQAEPNYKRTNDIWKQLVETEVPQKLSIIITMLGKLEQLNQEKAITTDEHSDLNEKINKLRDGIIKYEFAVDSFVKYKEKRETDDQRNLLLFMYDGFNILTGVEAEITEKLNSKPVKE